MKLYQHDLYGALQRGYARRCREGVEVAVLNAAGWANPSDPRNAKARSRIGLTLKILLESGRRLGMTEEEITRLLDREKATGEFGCRGAARDRAIQCERTRYTEDPSGGVDWSEYDAYVDGLSSEHVRRALKQEARLRVSAQRQAGIK